MNIDELLSEIETIASSLPAMFEQVSIVPAFGKEIPPIGDWSNAKRPGMLVKADELGARSGIYYFSSLAGEVLYIGKATKDNLHHRVWGHMKTPEGSEVGWRTFPSHNFTAGIQHQSLVEDATNGKIHLGVVTVSDPSLVSLIEVYLHTVHVKRYGRLPAFNKQIG